MSFSQILAEIPRLKPEERRKLLDAIAEAEEDAEDIAAWQAWQAAPGQLSTLEEVKADRPRA